MTAAARSATFLFAATDPMASGELRRLGSIALYLERRGWRAGFDSASTARLEAGAVAVAPASALGALPQFAEAGARIVVELDGDPAVECPQLGTTLKGLGGRIVAVAARSAAAAAWARGLMLPAPIRLVQDPAFDGVALEAAAVRYGLRSKDDQREPAWPPRFELWFAEPGDQISDEEVVALGTMWRPHDTPIVIAPEPVLNLLEQYGLDIPAIPFSPETLDEALARAERCVFGGGDLSLRRLARARAAGASFAVDPRLEAYSPEAVTSQWQAILLEAGSPAAQVDSEEPLTVVFLLDLMQDLDPALPVLDALRRRPDIRLRVVVSGWLRRRSPRVAVELGARDLPPEIYDRGALESGDRPDLQGADAVVAVVESNRSAHARAHALFGLARDLDIPTFSFQHGVENLGLNAPPTEDEKDLSLFSEHLLVWFPQDRTPETVQSDLRPRLVHIGRPSAPRASAPDLLGAFSDFAKVVAVFENLHWNRFDHAWRRRFLFDCAEFAAADPTRAVVLKPHHGGLWSVRNRHLIPQWPTNLILADPTDPFWEPHTAPALLQAADLVITTPSTVALDAVQAGKPVAIAAYGLELPAYAPLPLLHELRDWTSFSAGAGAGAEARRRAEFLTRTVRGGDAAARAARLIAATALDRRELRARRKGGV